jgi:hypothetical protein
MKTAIASSLLFAALGAAQTAPTRNLPPLCVTLV